MGYQIICCLHFNYIWLILFIAYIFKNYAHCENLKAFCFRRYLPYKGIQHHTGETMQTFPSPIAFSLQLGQEKRKRIYDLSSLNLK